MNVTARIMKLKQLIRGLFRTHSNIERGALPNHSVKKVFFFARSPYLCTLFDLFRTEKIILVGRCLVLQVILPEIRAVSFSEEFRGSDERNKFRTVELPKISNYPTENVDLTGHCVNTCVPIR